MSKGLRVILPKLKDDIELDSAASTIDSPSVSGLQNVMKQTRVPVRLKFGYNTAITIHAKTKYLALSAYTTMHMLCNLPRTYSS